MAANRAANRQANLLLEGDGTHHLPPPLRNVSKVDLLIPNLVDLELLSSGEGYRRFRATQLTPLRQVTVKVLDDDTTSPPAQRFDQERSVVGRLSGHSAVVPLFETGVTADGQPYLLMPFYPRGSLARLVHDHGRLSWREASFLLESIAVTMAEVHSHGVVHRNLTPKSVQLTDFLLPRVADFDLSLPVGQRSNGSTLAPSLFFSAPEMAVPMEADPSADVYSLGAVLYAMMSGQVGFGGDAALLAARSATAQARAGRVTNPALAMPDSLRALIARSMAEDPNGRPANGAAFVSELRNAVARPDDTGRPGKNGGASADLDLTSEANLTGGPAGPGFGASVAGAEADSGQGANRRSPAAPTSASPSPTGPSPTGPRPTGPSPTSASPTSAMPTGPSPTRPRPTSASPTSAMRTRRSPAPSEPNPGPSSARVDSDARYVLVLAACITVVILIMVVAAMVATS